MEDFLNTVKDLGTTAAPLINAIKGNSSNPTASVKQPVSATQAAQSKSLLVWIGVGVVAVIGVVLLVVLAKK